VRYDYKCDKCKYVIEVIQHHTEVGDYPCPCGGTMKPYFTEMPQLSSTCFPSKPIIDVETMRPMDMVDIKKKERETGKVFMGINEHHTECVKNEKRIEQERNEMISREFTEMASRKLAESGISD
jgi:hypothetical protein